MPSKNCCLKLCLLLSFSVSAQLKFPQFPDDFSKILLDYPSKTSITGLKELKLTKSRKIDGQPLEDLDVAYTYNYLRNGELKRFTKGYDSVIYEQIDYLHLNNKLYREIEKVGSAYLVTQYYYNGDKVNCKEFISRPESNDMVDILASQNDEPLENYTTEIEEGEKARIKVHIDHKRELRYTAREEYFPRSDSRFPYKIKRRSDANTAFEVWEFNYDSQGKITKAVHLKSKIIAIEYLYTYNKEGKLKSISKRLDGKERGVLEYFYGKNGLLRSTLESDLTSKELRLTNFRYTFY